MAILNNSDRAGSLSITSLTKCIKHGNNVVESKFSVNSGKRIPEKLVPARAQYTVISFAVR